MNKKFAEFQRFNSEAELEKCVKILIENNIEYLIEDVSINLDPVLSSNKLGIEFLLKIDQVNFEKANNILDELYSFEIDEIESDYYLFSFSDDELLDVIIKSDEWNKFDVQLAQKILKEKGKHFLFLLCGFVTILSSSSSLLVEIEKTHSDLSANLVPKCPFILLLLSVGFSCIKL